MKHKEQWNAHMLAGWYPPYWREFFFLDLFCYYFKLMPTCVSLCVDMCSQEQLPSEARGAGSLMLELQPVVNCLDMGARDRPWVGYRRDAGS